MNKLIFLLFIFALSLTRAYAQQKFTLSGFVVEKDSEEKLPGAIIKVNASSTFINSNEYGFYSLTLPQGNYVLRVAFSGAEDSQYQINLNQDLSLNLEIRTVNELEGVEVIAASKNVEQIRMGSQTGKTHTNYPSKHIKTSFGIEFITILSKNKHRSLIIHKIITTTLNTKQTAIGQSVLL